MIETWFLHVKCRCRGCNATCPPVWIGGTFSMCLHVCCSWVTYIVLQDEHLDRIFSPWNLYMGWVFECCAIARIENQHCVLKL